MFDSNNYVLYLGGFVLMALFVCVAIYIAFFMPHSAPNPDLEMGGVRRRRVLGVFGIRAQMNAGRRAAEVRTVEYVVLQELAPIYRVPEHGPTPPTYDEAVLGRDGRPAR
jgi:hypothetical protein